MTTGFLTSRSGCPGWSSKLGLAVATLALAFCAGDQTVVKKGVTGIQIATAHGAVIELDQLVFSGSLINGGPLFGPEARPDPAKPLSGSETSVVVVVSDDLGGAVVRLRVDALWQGASVGSAQRDVTILTGQIVDAALELGPPAECGDGAWVPDLEECDDGDQEDHDGCSAGCAVEAGYTCIQEPGGTSVCLTLCNNGEDDDGDGLSDLDDPGCDSTADVDEHGDDICDNGIDDDQDGGADYRVDGQGDEACAAPTDSTELNGGACNDGQDNDSDGDTDYRVDGTGDADCTSPTDPSESDVTECNNGSDDDGDLLTDFPEDPGCTSADDESEYGTKECDDGIDNDDDTFTDLDDPECDGPRDPKEDR